MRLLSEARERIRSLVARDEADHELDEEVRFHIEMETEANLRRGMAPDVARRRAIIAFGGMDRHKEAVRDERGMGLLEDLVGDVRFALRQLRRSPVFTAVAVATLALGIGGSTAIFSVVDRVLLRPLPFAEPDRLAMIWAQHPSNPEVRARVSEGYLHDWRESSRAFEEMAGWYEMPVTLGGVSGPTEVRADHATPNFFQVLGTAAVLGRTFAPAPMNAPEPEVVLSNGLWQRRFGADPAVVGRSIALSGGTYTIVGVMPADFAVRTAELPESRAELWIPYPLAPEARTGMPGRLSVVARLAAGATLDHARRDMAVITRRIEEDHPVVHAGWTADVRDLHAATVADVRLMLLVLFGAVGILLLIACANVANLVLSRAAARQRELAIRQSIGATRGRLVRQLLAENLVLASLGGALGVLVAIGAMRFLVSMLSAGFGLPRAGEIGLEPRVLAYSATLTVGVAVVFGAAPLANSLRSVPLAALRVADRGASAGRGRSRIRNLLVVSQMALALVLLAGAGLLSLSFRELSGVEPGFRAENVLTVRTTLPESLYDTDDRVRAFGRALLESVESLPGVESVGLGNYLPMTNFRMGGPFSIEGRPESDPSGTRSATIAVVGGSYFEAMGIPLLRGRVFGESDTETTRPVFVIDEHLARLHWMEQSPIGARLSWQRAGGVTYTGEVVGVVGSVRYSGMAEQPDPTVYFWFPQLPERQFTLVVRTQGDPLALAAPISSRVGEIDANQPVAEVRTMQSFVRDDIGQPRATMLILVTFALASLLLAAVGLYGVIAYGVAQRAREIGIRTALGAAPADVLRVVLGPVMRMTGIGIALGILGALVLGRALAGLLYGVTPAHPPTLVVVSLFLAAVAMLAAVVPARRAIRVEAVTALRDE